MAYDGFDAGELGGRLGTSQCIVLTRVTSTLDVVHEMAGDGTPGGLLVLADEQVRGRGRRGRAWQSPPGAGIWLGYLHRPAGEPAGGTLSLRVGLALVESLHELNIAGSIKWPNDVMVGERKVAGVLCEARTQGTAGWIAIGVGVNVYGPVDSAVAAVADSLDNTAPGISRFSVLERFVPRLHRLEDTPRLSDAEMGRFDSHDWLHGREIVEPARGVAAGITTEGALRVMNEGGAKLVFGGNVELA